ncbi:hypothetical protein ABC766_12960 [Methylobacterium fujisawaense]|uniref:hypothetical protein n=1 Tax=Methylobacterium fujisawaense TaxID=107400 RepID=UPI0031F5C2D2
MSAALLENPDCSHVALLRQLAARLEAIGTGAATDLLVRLSESTEAHIAVVEDTIAMVEALESSTPIH